MRAAILLWTAALAAQTRDVPFDGRNVLRAYGKADLIVGEHRVELKRGEVLYYIYDSGAPPVEIATPNVTVHPYLAGGYKVEVKKSGESIVTPLGGDVKVSSPQGVEWVPVGKKMIARGSALDPEFRVVSALSGWRWIGTALSQALQNGAVSAAVGTSSGDENSSSDHSSPAPPRNESPPAGRQSTANTSDARPPAASAHGK